MNTRTVLKHKWCYNAGWCLGWVLAWLALTWVDNYQFTILGLGITVTLIDSIKAWMIIWYGRHLRIVKLNSLGHHKA